MNLSHLLHDNLIGTLGASVVLLIGMLITVWRLLQLRHRAMLAKVQLVHQRVQRQAALELEQAQREIMIMRREIDLLSRKLREKSDPYGLMPASPDPAMRSKRRSASLIVVDDVLGTASDGNHGFADTTITIMPGEQP